MSLIHGIVAYAEGGVHGMQSTQRDWSPFLVHFTSADAMKSVREAVPAGKTPKEIKELLEAADKASWKVVEAIAKSGVLRAHVLEGKPTSDPCVSLSECTLPGLIALCERYGRFGFGFRKKDLFAAGARPCAYLGSTEYAVTKDLAKGEASASAKRRLHDLANTYVPAGAGGAMRDFTHEREWRLFAHVHLRSRPPEFIVCPSIYTDKARRLFPKVRQLFPIDVLFEWGA
ncbi:MAG: hypothetical protein RDV41_10015 [Planctomycetota bacterium]|nr:hypothetical protein [Planctomycetota bacterium]